ncbi:unnamed protein product, partial [Oppiella nova]
NYNIIELSVDSFWTWIIALLSVEFVYYWCHRAGHEVNLFWANHQYHHSGEDLNLSVASRFTAIEANYILFYLGTNLLAIILPPQVLLIQTQFAIIYQYTIHTTIIGKYGPLEHVLMTPSLHRVHHGSNPYCIDKNYGAILCVWDRKQFIDMNANSDSNSSGTSLKKPYVMNNDILIDIFSHMEIHELIRLERVSKQFQMCADYHFQRLKNIAFGTKSRLWINEYLPNKPDLQISSQTQRDFIGFQRNSQKFSLKFRGFDTDFDTLYETMIAFKALNSLFLNGAYRFDERESINLGLLLSSRIMSLFVVNFSQDSENMIELIPELTQLKALSIRLNESHIISKLLRCLPQSVRYLHLFSSTH